MEGEYEQEILEMERPARLGRFRSSTEKTRVSMGNVEYLGLNCIYLNIVEMKCTVLYIKSNDIPKPF